MTIILDHATEEKLQQELAVGRYREPVELIAHALELVQAERQALLERRAAFKVNLEESMAQAERGEGISEEQLRARMATLRTAHQEFKVA